MDSDADFAAVYRAGVAGLVRHVMFHGATTKQAWDAAQSASSQAYPVWARIRAPRAWLRTVAGPGVLALDGPGDHYRLSTRAA